jgi:hypothetical protein
MIDDNDDDNNNSDDDDDRLAGACGCDIGAVTGVT